MNTSIFNDGWKFCIGEKWDENTVEEVCLPHSVKLTPAISSGCRNYQGKCIYRKNFYAPADYYLKKVFLEFEGAMGVAELNVNGVKAGEHFCGYTPFIVDLGEFLKYGEENRLEVILDNSDNPEVPPGKPQEDLDFSYDGGLYRNAKISVFEPLYITNPILENEVAGGGIFVWFTDVSEKVATVHIRTQVKNEFPIKKDFELKLSLNYKGDLVDNISFEGSLASGEKQYFEGEIKVENPMLWSPETPELYSLCCEIINDNKIIFGQSVEIGIRTFNFTVNDGVIFNGKSRRFNGGNYHQTWPYIGNAVPDNLLVRDILKIKEMGMDNIRSHYPFGTAFTDACNRIGMTLIVSNPGWQFFKEGIFRQRSLQNMREIVRWQRNNPCVLFWEPMLNESAMDYDAQLEFHLAVHEEYPYPLCYTASDYGPTDIAFKEYDPAMLGKGLEEYGLVERDDSIERPFWVREYGDAPDDFYNQNAAWRCMRGWGDHAMVESVYRMIGLFDTTKNPGYIRVYNNKRLCGYGVWPAIAHNRGYHINPCWGGHLDLFRLPKFSYYFMRSQMEREQIGDFLFIANWWGEISPIDVTIFSNAETVKLYRNDELIAEQAPVNLPLKHPPFIFKDVKRNYKLRGRSTLTAKAFVGDKLVAEQSVLSPGVPHHLSLEVDYMGVPFKSGGFDIVAVRCYIKDLGNNIVPLTGDVHPIIFEIEGQGEIIGDYKIGANPVCAEAGIATILVRSKKDAGKIKIRAKMFWEQPMKHGILPSEIVFESE